MHCSMNVPSQNISFNMTVVYGLHIIADRWAMWNELNEISTYQQEPWLVIGDFNSIRGSEDRIMSNYVHEAEIEDFNSFMMSNNMEN